MATTQLNMADNTSLPEFCKEKLRNEGIDCMLDQYETSPPEGWPRWMDKQIRDANFVLMVCAQTGYGGA